MKIILRHLLYVVVVACTVSLQSANAQFSFRHLTTRNGLIQGTVEYFLEDQRGYMWMTTQAGLNRFDGQKFDAFVHNDRDSQSIGKGQLHGLVEAPGGDIWIGTEVCVSRYVRSSNKFRNYYVNDASGKRLFSHHNVFYANDSTVWYLNNPEGVVAMNYHTGRKRIVLPETGFRFESATQIVHFDPSKEILWLKQPFGILKFNCRTKHRQYYFTGRDKDAFRERLEVFALYSVDHQSFWLSTNAGLVHLQNGKFELHDIDIDFINDPVYSLAMNKDNQLWITTSKSGLIVYDTAKRIVVHRLAHKPFQENTLLHNHLSSVFVDSKGVVWANVDPQSVDVIYPSKMAPVKFADDPLDPDDLNNVGIRGLSEDKAGNLWVGTIGEGIRKFSQKDKSVTAFRAENGLLQNNIRGILTDSQGNIWFCTKEGLNVIRPGKTQLESITIKGIKDPAGANYTKGIIEVAPDQYVVATMGGLYTLNSIGAYKLLADEKEAFSGALYFDPPKKLLYAGRADKDLRCYKLTDRQAEVVFDALPGFNILTMTPEGQNLWIGTDNGLVHYNPAKRSVIKIFSVKDGLPDHVIYAVLSDHRGGYWLSTNKGISRFDGKSNFRQIRHTGNIEFNSFAAWKSSDGGMFFGSVEGLFQIYPKSFDNPSSRGLVLKNLVVNDSDYFDIGSKAEETIKLAHDRNNVRVEAAVLDFISRIEPVFQYRFRDGKDQGNWLTNGSDPVFKFGNLSPGNYVLEVRALDANGFYTELKSVSFQISPPFWQTWWFIFLTLLLVVTGLYLLVKYYLKRQQLAERKLTNRIIDAQELERLRMSQDIHDDVNNTLAAAKGYLQNFDSDTITDLTENAARSTALIQKATEDLRNITHNLRPVEFEKYNLSEVIQQRVRQWNEVPDIDFEFILAGKERKLNPQCELMIYRIITESVQNIRKHSRANSSIIQLIYQEQNLVVSLEDDGVGFQEQNKNENKKEGIGLKNLYSRAQFIKAVLEINSDENGVLVQLTVPYVLNAYDPHYSG